MSYDSAGPIGGRGVFNGSTSIINIPNESTFDYQYNNSFTLMAWIKSTQTAASTFGIITKYDTTTTGYFMAMLSGKLYFQLQQSASIYKYKIGTNSINSGNWVHVAATYSGSNSLSGLNIYVNGVSEPTTDAIELGTITTMLNNTPVKIGYRQAGGAYWYGGISQVQIYNSCLNVSDIKRAMNGLHPLLRS
jgi:hypothetical protein